MSPIAEEKLKKGVGAAAAAAGEAAGEPKDTNGVGILLAHDEEEEEEVSLGEFSTDEDDLVVCEVVAGVLACEAIHLSATPALVSCDGGVWGTSTLPSIPYPDSIPPPSLTLPQSDATTPKLKINDHELNVRSSTDHSTLKSTERQRSRSKVSIAFTIRIETTPREKWARQPLPLPRSHTKTRPSTKRAQSVTS